VRKFALVAVALAWVLAAAQPSSGQEGRPRGRFGFDFRLGALWQEEAAFVGQDTTQFSMGGRFAFYPSRKTLLRRFSAQFAFDKAPVSKTDFFDPLLGTRARLREDIWVLSPRLAFDVVQRSRVELSLHYGGAGVGDRQRLQLLSAYGTFQDVCDLVEFAAYCTSDWSFVGNAGAGLRFYPLGDWPFYFGGEYTRFAGRKNQLLGTIGLSF